MSRKPLLVLALTFTTLGGAAAPVHAAAAASGTMDIGAVSVAVYGPTSNPPESTCFPLHPPYGNCGYALVDFDVSGFDAYGGIPTCDPATQSCDPGDRTMGGLGTPASAVLKQVYRCGTDPTRRSATLAVTPSVRWHGDSAQVNWATRTNSNTARLSAGVEFPMPTSYSSCPDDMVLIDAALSGIVVSYSGTDRIPGATGRVAGSFQVPLPGAPSSLVTKTTSTTQADLTWSPPAAGGPSVTGYRVSRDGVDSSGAGPWSTALPPSARSFGFTKLVPARTYHFSVVPLSGTGTGLAATSAPRMPGATAPRSFSIVRQPAVHSATVSWSPPAVTQGHAVLGYRVARTGTDAGGAGPWSTTLPAGARSFTFGKLVPGSTYSLSVQAVTSSGPGAVSRGSVLLP